MVRIVQEVEPICFEQAVGNLKWDNVIIPHFWCENVMEAQRSKNFKEFYRSTSVIW
jgi:hypothetical protein